MAGSSRYRPPTGRSPGRTVVALVVGFVALCAVVVAIGWILTHPLKDTMRGENDVSRWLAGRRTGTLTDVADGGTLLGETVTGLAVLAGRA